MSEFTDRVLRNIELKEQQLLLETYQEIFNEELGTVDSAVTLGAVLGIQALMNKYKEWKARRAEAKTAAQQELAQRQMDQLKNQIRSKKKIKV